MGAVTPNMLTRRYLVEAAARGAEPARLVEVARQLIDLTATSYDGDCLTRPVFLEHAEFSVLRDDLLALHAALASLPVRLFGGDVAAFARAVGMTGAQVTAIERAGSRAPTMSPIVAAALIGVGGSVIVNLQVSPAPRGSHLRWSRNVA